MKNSKQPQIKRYIIDYYELNFPVAFVNRTGVKIILTGDCVEQKEVGRITENTNINLNK